jgi:hypothetical protein
MTISKKMPEISKRISMLRERCLDRKAAGINALNWRAVIDADVLKRDEYMEL